MAVSGMLFFGIPATEMNESQQKFVITPSTRPQETQKAQAESSNAVRTDRHSQEVLQLSRTNSLEGKISRAPEVKQPSIALTSGVVLEEALTQKSLLTNDFNLNSKKLSSFELGSWILKFTDFSAPTRNLRKQKISPWAFEVGYDQNQTQFNYQVSSAQQKYVHKNYLNRMREGEFSLSAPQFHTALRYDLNSRWHASIGLGFAQTKTSQNFNFRDSVPVSVGQGQEADAFGNYPIFGYAGLGQQVNYDGVQTINMVSIPMNIGYNYPVNRLWSITAEGSARYNLISGSIGKTLNYHTLELMNADQQVYRNSIVTARVAAGVERRLGLKKWFGVRLNTQGSITPLFKQDAAVQNRGWSVGLSAYYYWKLF